MEKRLFRNKQEKLQAHSKDTVMPEDRNCKLLPNRSPDLRRKKRNKATATIPKLKGKPVSVSPTPQLPTQDPGQSQLPKLSVTRKKGRDHCSRGSGKKKERQRDSRSLPAAATTTCGSKVPANVTEHKVQARESLRWEGVLQDPQEEAKRLERYRASRRQRYISHREALLKDAQQTPRQAEQKATTD